MRLAREEFEELVAEAVAGLPPEFADKLDNVEFMVEDYPGPDELDLPREPGTMLLGLYRGTPLTERSTFAPSMLPDQIVLFQRPLERLCRTRRQMVEQIRRTVLHEIAHHFGISDERLDELGC